MARHVLNNAQVCKAFVNKSVSHARNSSETLHFSDHKTLYSYSLPIAWRNKHGKFVVRNDWHTQTTKTHISRIRSMAPPSALLHVPVEKFQNLGIDVDDIRDYNTLSTVMGITYCTFERGSDVYTLLEMGAKAFSDLYKVRNLTPVRFCFKSESLPVDPAALALSLLPEEYLQEAYDGWVAYTGEWFFVGKPDIDARKHPETISKWPSLDGGYRTTEGLGRYVRGVVYDANDKTLFSFGSDGRGPYDKYWYLPVRPKIQPLPFPLPYDFHTQSLGEKELACVRRVRS